MGVYINCVYTITITPIQGLVLASSSTLVIQSGDQVLTELCTGLVESEQHLNFGLQHNMQCIPNIASALKLQLFQLLPNNQDKATSQVTMLFVYQCADIIILPHHL